MSCEILQYFESEEKDENISRFKQNICEEKMEEAEKHSQIHFKQGEETQVIDSPGFLLQPWEYKAWKNTWETNKYLIFNTQHHHQPRQEQQNLLQ